MNEMAAVVIFDDTPGGVFVYTARETDLSAAELSTIQRAQGLVLHPDDAPSVYKLVYDSDNDSWDSRVKEIRHVDLVGLDIRYVVQFYARGSRT